MSSMIHSTFGVGIEGNLNEDYAVCRHDLHVFLVGHVQSALQGHIDMALCISMP